MKRKREAEMGSEIRSAIDELSLMILKVKPTSGGAVEIPTKPFLSLCNLTLQVLDKIGPTMAVLRQDIHQNIQRLEKLYESDPSLYGNIVEILKKEASEGNSRKCLSCSKAFVWLTRSLDFTVTLLQLLVEDFDRKLEKAVDESYNTTLKPWHGWISSAAYKVALKLVPDTTSLINLLNSNHQNHDILKEQLQTLISLLLPILKEIHNILETYELDRLKCT
ncbi:hypothetical protein M9H77_31525 [Catharanthus roseus]|uniref:Uncharacterized protein n=1 Tax=Catharanthus roseus TaxID=4058 RepID=A0ACC0A4L2_CATRO|nr:hypothetical protein M9H77_31525 [Catharanthus roseus]